MAAPPKITTPNFILKYNFVHELGTGQKVGTAMYFLYTTSGARPSVANLQTLATTAATAWNTNCASLLNHDSVLVAVSAQDVYDVTGAFGIVTVSHAGTRSGDMPTTFSCANVNYQINQHYRGGKPKGFWPFGIVGDTSNQSDWGPSFVSAVNTGIAALSAAINGSTAGATTVGAQQAVSFFQGAQANPSSSPWSKKNKPKPRATAVIYAVNAPVCATKIASQRRRRV